MTDAASDPQATFSGTREVDPRYALDGAALDRWMDRNVAGYVGPLTVRQFKGGQSNPTYELTTPGAAYVLRRKPPGVLLPSAHAVDREFTVISALHAQGFPVARPHALCTDEAVLGSIFYVMDKVEGRVLWDLKLPGVEPGQRRAIYDAQVDTLAALHAVDPTAIGLADYGRPGNYFERQVGRWTKQYRASEIEPIPAMDRLIEFLPATLPLEGRAAGEVVQVTLQAVSPPF
jgi:aminoglycoside phosphotransferase (APT) family kinase protein